MIEEFLKTPAGHAVFGVLVALLTILIIELNYKIFFKYVLDFLFALLSVIVLSPLLTACAIISKKRAGEVFNKKPYLGAKGKIIYVRTFAGVENSLKYLSRILDVLSGKLSFVGVSLLKLSDGALLSDLQMDRFGTRPGLVNHLALHGDDKLTYEEAFGLDARYVKKREFFTDVFIILRSLVLAARGDGKSYLGETRDKSFGEVLLSRGAITEEEFTSAERLAEDAVAEDARRIEFANSKLG